MLTPDIGGCLQRRRIVGHRQLCLLGLVLMASCARNPAPENGTSAPAGEETEPVPQAPPCPTDRTVVAGYQSVPLVLRAAWYESAGIDPASPRFVLVEESPLRLLNRDEISQAVSEAYPKDLRDAGVSTIVTVGLRVHPDGTTDDRVVVRTSGYDPVDEAALAVAERMEFAPPELDGCPVTVRAALPIPFEVR